MPAGPEHAGDPAARDALSLARSRSARLVLVGLVATALSGLLPMDVPRQFPVLPVALAGLVGPLIGYRYYHFRRERVPATAPAGARRRAFVGATVSALAITAATAVAGAIVFALTREPHALVGALGHVLLTGVVWPTEERLELFLEAPDDSGPAVRS